MTVAVIAVAGFAFGILKWRYPPRSPRARRELSYTITGPVVRLDRSLLGDAELSVAGVTAAEVFSYVVRCWNSGEEALETFAIQVDFAPQAAEFILLKEFHVTEPSTGFGRIEVLTTEPCTREYRLELMNRSQAVVFTFLATGKADLDFGAVCPGLVQRKVEPETLSSSGTPVWYSAVLGVVGLLSVAVLGSVSLWLLRRMDMGARDSLLRVNRQAIDAVEEMHDTADALRSVSVGEMSDPNALIVLSARYGAAGSYANVGPQLRSAIKDGLIEMEVNDHTLDCVGPRDPAPGKPKDLRASYRYAGRTHRIHRQQGEMLRLPPGGGKP